MWLWVQKREKYKNENRVLWTHGKTVVVVDWSLSHVWLLVIPVSAASQASLSLTLSWNFFNPYPLSQWCHPTISSSVALFSCWLQSFPASGSLSMSQLFPSGGENIGASASASVLPINIQGWFAPGLAGLISL